MTSPSNTCYITGCRLIVPVLGAHRWGDLHNFEGIWIFNGSGSPWEYGPVPTGEKSITLHTDFPFVQLHDVVIFPMRSGGLSTEAQEYVNG